MKPALRTIVRSLPLAAAASIFALAIAELGLRFGAHHVMEEGEWLSLGQINTDDPLLGFSMEPGSSRLEISGGSFTRRVRINSMGLRDVEHSLENGAERTRILMLGDSMIYGWAVGPEETTPRQLARLMPDAEFINSAVPGYDLGQEFLYYIHRGSLLQPDVVLLAFFVNDLVEYRDVIPEDGPDGLPVRYRRSPEAVLRERKDAPRNALTGWLRSHSVLYVLVRMRIDGLLLRAELGGGGDGSPAVDAPVLQSYLAAFRGDSSTRAEWERAFRILEELKLRVEENGARFAVVLFPAPWQVSEADWDRWVGWWKVPEETLSWRRPQEMVLDWCGRSATPCHDLLEEFGGKDTGRLYIKRDFHFTAEGHALAARGISGFLRSAGLAD